MKFLLFITYITTLALSGCAYLGPQHYRHVIEDKTGSDQVSDKDNRVGTFALVAERRMVLVKFKDGSFCAEPPPDAADNLSAALTAGITANQSSIETSARAATNISSYAKQLFYRSQGVQLYRDGMFSLCVHHLNGAITQPQMNEQINKLLSVSEKLIQAEIPELKNIKWDSGTAPNVSATSEPPAQAKSTQSSVAEKTSGKGQPTDEAQ